MPLIRMETSAKLSEDKKSEVVLQLSKIAAEATGKPEQYVMATVAESTICFAGKIGPAAFLDFRSIGSINNLINRKISKDVTALLEKSLGIPGDRIYSTFTDVPASNWGWNGSTFG